jgi:hypothetical protein
MEFLRQNFLKSLHCNTPSHKGNDTIYDLDVITLPAAMRFMSVLEIPMESGQA